jgi:hypothetical protein
MVVFAPSLMEIAACGASQVMYTYVPSQLHNSEHFKKYPMVFPVKGYPQIWLAR